MDANTPWRIRDFHPDDLDAAVRLWDNPAASSELFPSRLAGESAAGLAAALREAFALIAELDKVVVFIDEVEEIAGMRQPRTVSAAQGVTNEMLKLIPPFREQDERLLICATKDRKSVV